MNFEIFGYLKAGNFTPNCPNDLLNTYSNY